MRIRNDQLRKLEDRAGGKLAVGNLIRCAIDAYLRQEEQRDYLADVEARIAATINRLARQVEKDRAEQQIVVAMVDGLREWLAFTLPTPTDKQKAAELMAERNTVVFSAGLGMISAIGHWRACAGQILQSIGTNDARTVELKTRSGWNSN